MLAHIGRLTAGEGAVEDGPVGRVVERHGPSLGRGDHPGADAAIPDGRRHLVVGQHVVGREERGAAGEAQEVIELLAPGPGIHRHGGQVLEAVDRDIDRPGQNGSLDFLGERALAAKRG